MRERGGIFIFLLILIFLIGGFFLILKIAWDSLPNEPLYQVKGILEQLQLSTTELDRGQRASAYMTLADRRLDELVRLENKNGSPKQLLEMAQLFLENEQKAIDEINRESRGVSVSNAINKLLSINQKAGIIFSRILDKTPAPEYYSFLKLKQQVEDTSDKFSRNN